MFKDFALAAAITMAVFSPADAHEMQQFSTQADYPTLEGHQDGGYFRPFGVDGPEMMDTSFVYEWVAENSDKFETTDVEDPVIRFLTQEQMEDFVGDGMGDVVALYEEGYMYFNENIDFSTTTDQSVVFHELIHHLQWANGWNDEEHYQVCPFHLEKDAYALQIDWLEENDGDPEWIYAMQVSGFAAGGLICYPDRPFG